MVSMEPTIISHRVEENPNQPLVTVYNESKRERIELSAQTLQLWVAKVTNLLGVSSYMEPGLISVAARPSWQSLIMWLGGANFGIKVISSGIEPDTMFMVTDCRADLGNHDNFLTETFPYWEDAWGRTLFELGKESLLDYYHAQSCLMSELRIHSDTSNYPCVDPTQFNGTTRALIFGWHDQEDFDEKVTNRLAGSGSIVLVTGMASADRIQAIMEMEKVDEVIN